MYALAADQQVDFCPNDVFKKAPGEWSTGGQVSPPRHPLPRQIFGFMGFKRNSIEHPAYKLKT